MLTVAPSNSTFSSKKQRRHRHRRSSEGQRSHGCGYDVADTDPRPKSSDGDSKLKPKTRGSLHLMYPGSRRRSRCRRSPEPSSLSSNHNSNHSASSIWHRRVRRDHESNGAVRSTERDTGPRRGPDCGLDRRRPRQKDGGRVISRTGYLRKEGGMSGNGWSRGSDERGLQRQ